MQLKMKEYDELYNELHEDDNEKNLNKRKI